MLDKDTYLKAFRQEAGALATAARRDLTVPAPSCPGWTVATLVTHLTRIYAHWLRPLKTRPLPCPIEQFEELELPAEFSYKAWFDAEQEDLSMLPRLLDLFAWSVDELSRLLWALDPGEPVATWWPADQTAGFLQRRVTQETAVHRWDTQLAYGDPEPIAADLASDGIDEMLDVILVARRGLVETARQGSGETYHFHRTDGPGEWLVRFEPAGPVVTREHATGDLAVRGPASDLLLFLWHRIPAEPLEVFGDRSLLSRYFELAPPD